MPVIHISDQELRKITNMNRKLPSVKESAGGSVRDNECFDINDAHIRETLKLCYVGTDGEDNDLPVHICYFTEESLDDVWGDDWDDVPYEHNAGIPNTPCLTLLAINVESARRGYLNSPYSVEGINNGDVPWLTDGDNNELYAGATVNEFIQFIEDSPNGIYV